VNDVKRYVILGVSVGTVVNVYLLMTGHISRSARIVLAFSSDRYTITDFL
jgi:hypothetical protein